MAVIQYRKGRVAKQAHVAIPEGLFEEEHGRRGFAGSVSQLYHLHPPTQWSRIEGPLRPRAIRTHQFEPDDLSDARGLPMPIFHNEDAIISISRRAEPMLFCLRNADGDELHFIHRGAGLIRTDYGPLRYEEGDYVLIPKGTTYQIIPDGRDNLSLVVQARGEIGFPERGNIGHYAPFDYGVIETPEPEPVPDGGHEWELRIKRRGQLTSVFFEFCPFDVVGWKGNLTALKLNVRDIRPLMSEGVHLPPSAHCNFQAPGLAVCTFLPRPLEGDRQAERVPWYHRNIDYDEVFFIHAGHFSFTGEQAGPTAGTMFLNPAGLHHGATRKELEAARANWHKDARLDMTAINIDCERPLEMSARAEAAIAAARKARQ
jgi:homogentisate 1,2-dioxygenase